jgi:hypothetical protein
MLAAWSCGGRLVPGRVVVCRRRSSLIGRRCVGPTRDLDRSQAELARRTSIALLASALALRDAERAAFTRAAVDLAGPIGGPWSSGSRSWVR